jgi:hypothetical protein
MQVLHSSAAVSAAKVILRGRIHRLQMLLVLKPANSHSDVGLPEGTVHLIESAGDICMILYPTKLRGQAAFKTSKRQQIIA